MMRTMFLLMSSFLMWGCMGTFAPTHNAGPARERGQPVEVPDIYTLLGAKAYFCKADQPQWQQLREFFSPERVYQGSELIEFRPHRAGDEGFVIDDDYRSWLTDGRTIRARRLREAFADADAEDRAGEGIDFTEAGPVVRQPLPISLPKVLVFTPLPVFADSGYGFFPPTAGRGSRLLKLPDEGAELLRRSASGDKKRPAAIIDYRYKLAGCSRSGHLKSVLQSLRLFAATHTAGIHTRGALLYEWRLHGQPPRQP